MMKKSTSYPTDSRSAHEKAMSDLEAEVKLLNWHKIANETAIQTALMRTKIIREEENRIKPVLEKSKRLQCKERLNRVKEEETRKPLEITKEIFNRHEEENRRGYLAIEKREELRESQILRAKQKTEDQKELQSRMAYYRAVKANLRNKGLYLRGECGEGSSQSCDRSAKNGSQNAKCRETDREELRQVLKKLEEASMALNKY